MKYHIRRGKMTVCGFRITSQKILNKYTMRYKRINPKWKIPICYWCSQGKISKYR